MKSDGLDAYRWVVRWCMSIDGRRDGLSTPPRSNDAPDQEQEQVAPRRAAQRLYDEMALAYHEQADLDREISRAFLPAALKSLRDDED